MSCQHGARWISCSEIGCTLWLQVQLPFRDSNYGPPDSTLTRMYAGVFQPVSFKNAKFKLLWRLPEKTQRGKLVVLGEVLGQLLRRLPGRVPFLCSSRQGQSPVTLTQPLALPQALPASPAVSPGRLHGNFEEFGLGAL